MNKLLKVGLLGSVGVFALGLIGAATLSAQSNQAGGNGFRISPVRAEYTIEKGKTQDMTVTVENPTELAITAKPKVTDFLASDNESGETRPLLDANAPKPKNSFTSLVSMPDAIDLGAKEKKDINVKISVPADANAGGYYGVILFEPATINNTGNVGLSASTGPIVLVRVPGNLSEKVDLLELAAAQNGKAKSFMTSGDVTSMVRLKNTGNIHVKPFGKVQIKNMFGKVVSSYELNSVEPRANILPDSARKFEDGVKYKSWLGRYTIEANIGYSQGGGELITATSTFWYVPAWALAVLVVLLLGIAGGGYMLVRKFKGGRHHGSK